jgi:hypothetical protein
MNIPKYNEPYFHRITVELIKKYEEFKLIMQSQFPEISDDIQSASVNPNCGCIARVEKVFLENRDKVMGIVNQFASEYSEDDKINLILKMDYESFSPKPYNGKMFIIDNDEESYSKFIENIQKDRAMFRWFSTAIDSNNKLHIYFI